MNYSPALAADLVADYQFNNTLSSSVAGAPDLIDLGTTNSFGSGTIEGEEVTVFNFAEQTGLELPTLGLIPNNTYSIAILFEFDTVSGFRKILDFLDRAEDTGLYNFNGVYDFFGAGSPGNGTTTYEANQYIQTVVTRDASGQFSAYLDGNQEFSFNDSGSLAVISGSMDNVLRFFRDDLSTGDSENSGGSVARIPELPL